MNYTTPGFCGHFSAERGELLDIEMIMSLSRCLYNLCPSILLSGILLANCSSVAPSLSLSVCSSVCFRLSVCTSVFLSASLSVCPSAACVSARLPGCSHYLSFSVSRMTDEDSLRVIVGGIVRMQGNPHLISRL